MGGKGEVERWEALLGCGRTCAMIQYVLVQAGSTEGLRYNKQKVYLYSYHSDT